MNKNLFVIIPAYNEEKTIKRVVEDVLSNEHVKKCVVVDNNSNDNTFNIVMQMAEKNINKLVLLCEKKQGKGFAFKKGLNECIDADYVGVIDADDTYDALAFDDMFIVATKEDLDMVVGNRFELGGYQSSNDRRGHILGNKILSGIIKYVSGVEIEDALSGQRIFSTYFVKSFKSIADGFQLETEFSIHCGIHGFRYNEFPIKFLERSKENPSKLNTFKDGFRILRFAFFNTALTFSSITGAILGLTFVIIGLALGIRLIFEFFEQGAVTSVATAVASAIFFTSGLQFILSSGLDSRLRRIERSLLK